MSQEHISRFFILTGMGEGPKMPLTGTDSFQHEKTQALLGGKNEVREVMGSRTRYFRGVLFL
jgi:hypothetical protein